DDGAVIEDISYVVACRCNNFYATFKRLVVGLCTNKCGQKRVMDVNNLLRISAHERLGENLHVTREDDEVDAVVLEHGNDLLVGCGFILLFNGNKEKWNAIEVGDA